MPDASFLLEQWDARYQRHFKSLYDESCQLKERAARLAPSGDKPEEQLSGELIAVGERYLEVELRLRELADEDAAIRADVEDALRVAQKLDGMISEALEALEAKLSEDRQALRDQPHLVSDLRHVISTHKRRIRLLEQASERLHQCRWCELRPSFDDLIQTGWELRSLTDFAIGQDPMMGRAGAVGQMESVQQRLDRLTR